MTDAGIWDVQAIQTHFQQEIEKLVNRLCKFQLKKGKNILYGFITNQMFIMLNQVMKLLTHYSMNPHRCFMNDTGKEESGNHFGKSFIHQKSTSSYGSSSTMMDWLLDRESKKDSLLWIP
ncbi:hypothetical protein PIB30_065666 [Stylosanthes scabra]|uniref:Uncharacterized protein n=1 Tax=Stylosanthes scabra TaxID=79078 RepID=A0ABU6WLQ5_9FABA|nr:hypothetical protein [Stylosanthes scabra]